MLAVRKDEKKAEDGDEDSDAIIEEAEAKVMGGEPKRFEHLEQTDR